MHTVRVEKKSLPSQVVEDDIVEGDMIRSCMYKGRASSSILETKDVLPPMKPCSRFWDYQRLVRELRGVMLAGVLFLTLYRFPSQPTPCSLLGRRAIAAFI